MGRDTENVAFKYRSVGKQIVHWYTMQIHNSICWIIHKYFIFGIPHIALNHDINRSIKPHKSSMIIFSIIYKQLFSPFKILKNTVKISLYISEWYPSILCCILPLDPYNDSLWDWTVEIELLYSGIVIKHDNVYICLS